MHIFVTASLDIMAIIMYTCFAFLLSLSLAPSRPPPPDDGAPQRPPLPAEEVDEMEQEAPLQSSNPIGVCYHFN